MNCYWLVGEAGIVIEVIGAGYIVYSAYDSKKTMERHVNTANTINGIGGAVSELTRIVGSQFEQEAVGFLILVMGLIMQFIGGFA